MAKDIISEYASEVFLGNMRGEVKELDTRFDEIERWEDFIVNGINAVCIVSHHIAAVSGWWHEKAEGGYKLKERNFGEIIALIHSELSEGLEGHRKQLQSDHIPNYSMLEEELADAIIRIADLARVMNLRLGDAIIDKMKFNCIRKDHKLEEREKEDGKKF